MRLEGDAGRDKNCSDIYLEQRSETAGVTLYRN
jgi:hypothetical protein